MDMQSHRGVMLLKIECINMHLHSKPICLGPFVWAEAADRPFPPKLVERLSGCAGNKSFERRPLLLGDHGLKKVRSYSKIYCLWQWHGLIIHNIKSFVYSQQKQDICISEYYQWFQIFWPSISWGPANDFQSRNFYIIWLHDYRIAW